MKKIVSFGKVLSQNAGERFLYLTKEGAVVLSKVGEIITAYSAKDFTDEIIELLKLLEIM